jgi:NitT/TauT family transport system substrate-binding protein
MQLTQSRRDFLARLSAAGAAGVLGGRTSLADEGPPETTTIRLPHDPSVCVVPAYMADDLLRAEGFTDVRYVPTLAGFTVTRMAGRGEIDLAIIFASSIVFHLDGGEPVTALAGVHPGCFELFASERIHQIIDLKGRSIGTEALGSGQHVFLSAILAYVGLDPVSDINWFPAYPRSPGSCSPRAKSMPSSAFRPTPNRCVPEASVM